MNHQGAGTEFFHGRGLLLFFTLAIAISTTAAQTPGVTDKITAFWSDPARRSTGQLVSSATTPCWGATTYLHSINDESGVFGRKVQLLAFDDGYDPKTAPACFRRMTKEGVFALGFFVGTPTAKG